MKVHVVTASRNGHRLILGVLNIKPTDEQMWNMLRDFLRQDSINEDGGRLSEDDLTSLLNAYVIPESMEWDVTEPPKKQKAGLLWSIVSRFEYSYCFGNAGVVVFVCLQRSGAGDLRLRWHQECDTEDAVLPLHRDQDFEFCASWLSDRLTALPYGDVVRILDQDGTGLFGLADKLQLKYDRVHYATERDLPLVSLH